MGLDDKEMTLVAQDAAKDSEGNQIDLDYRVKIIKAFPQTGDTPFSGTPAFKPENSFQYNLSGKTEQPTLEFVMYNDGTDRSNTSVSNTTVNDIAEVADGIGYTSFNDPRLGSTIETKEEQKIWVKEYIHNNALPVTWKLYGRDYTDRITQGNGTPITITQVEPRPIPGENKIRMVVRFNLGKRLI